MLKAHAPQSLTRSVLHCCPRTRHTCVLSVGCHSLREVLSRVDSKEFGSNSAVVVEYLKALNVTGKISEYSTSGMVSGLLLLLLAGEASFIQTRPPWPKPDCVLLGCPTLKPAVFAFLNTSLRMSSLSHHDALLARPVLCGHQCQCCYCDKCDRHSVLLYGITSADSNSL